MLRQFLVGAAVTVYQHRHGKNLASFVGPRGARMTLLQWPLMKLLAVIVAATLVPLAATAESTSVLATKRPITWGMIFAVLFLMLGPIKLIGPFAAITKDCDRAFCFRLATRAFLFSLAFPTIVTPYGIAAVTILVTLAPTIEISLMSAGVAYFKNPAEFTSSLASDRRAHVSQTLSDVVGSRNPPVESGKTGERPPWYRVSASAVP